MNITGKLHVKRETQEVSERFRKREFVVEYADNPLYPQLIQFQLTQDRCEVLDEYKVGQMIEVQFNLRGRLWTSPQGEDKYFNTLDAWRLSPSDQAAPEPIPAAEVVTATAKTTGDDDLPF